MDKREEEELKRLREAADRVKERRKTPGFRIPHKVKTALIWTLFFTVVGVIQKSIIEGRFVLIDFFSKFYIAWFNSFGNFSDNYAIVEPTDLVYMIIKDWYYFFITGGVLSLIWSVIYSLFNSKLETRKDELTLYVDNKLSR